MAQSEFAVCVFAVSSLLFPVFLLVCACCAMGKSRSSSIKRSQKFPTKEAEEEGVGSGKDKANQMSPSSQSQPTGSHTTEENEQNLVVRRLPSLPKLRSVSLVYDVVVEMQNEWPGMEPRVPRRQAYSSLYEEVERREEEEVWGKEEEGDSRNCKVKPADSGDMVSSDGRKDFPLYAKVNKTCIHTVKSDLVL